MDSKEVCIELLSQGIRAVWMMDSGNSQASVLPFLHQQLQQEAQRRVNRELSLPHHTAALFSWCCFHDNRFPQDPSYIFESDGMGLGCQGKGNLSSLSI